MLVGGLLAAAGPAAQANTPQAGTDKVAVANTLVSGHRSAVHGAAGDSYAVYSVRTDPNGAAHVRYTRTFHGLPVYGGDFVMHTTAAGGFAGVSNALAAPLTLSTSPAVSTARATAVARHHFAGTLSRTDSTKLVVDASSGTSRLAWETVLRGMAADGQTPSVLHVLTDARGGGFLRSWDEIETATGTGKTLYSGNVSVSTSGAAPNFTMIDATHGNGRTCDMNNGSSTCTTFTDADNIWGNNANSNRQSAGADAHYGAAKTFDYYKNVHGRNGIFGNGTGVPSRVHYGNSYVNAFWDGAQMTYGDGSGNARPLVAIDVAGHEMSHGVTEHVVPGGLTYSGESGGLNEGTSDIFGTMVEFYAANATDPGDYNIGEKINIFGDGKPLRYMYNPALDGASHSCWSSSTKNVDVHYSSGVANHFFFDLAQGTGATSYGTSPVCSGAPKVVGIGRAKSEKIWFRALDLYFTSSTQYVSTSNPSNTARAYTLHAAKDLYGNCSTEYKTVQAAWRAVNVTGSDAACP